MKWQPWIDFKQPPSPPLLPIAEPPCKECKHWSPRYQYNANGTPGGIRICWANEQHHDFSCHEEKDSDKESGK